MIKVSRKRKKIIINCAGWEEGRTGACIGGVLVTMSLTPYYCGKDVNS
jgi:hypothetical protein